MSQQQSKFSPLTMRVKQRIRQLRLIAGYSMTEGARLLSISRKQLEDIETTRDYGCRIDLEILAKVKVIYQSSLDDILGDLPEDRYSAFYIRHRRRNAKIAPADDETA